MTVTILVAATFGIVASLVHMTSIAIAALWLVNALWLGRRQQALEAAGPRG